MLIRPNKVEQARSGTVGERLLRNPLRRKLILELRNEHRGDYMVCLWV